MTDAIFWESGTADASLFQSLTMLMSQTFGGMETKWDAHISLQARARREKERGRKQDTGATHEGESENIRDSEESWENISSRQKGQRLSDKMDDASVHYCSMSAV